VTVAGIASPALMPPTLADSTSVGTPPPGGIDSAMASAAVTPPNAVAHGDQSRMLERALLSGIASASGTEWAPSICAMRARTAAATFGGDAGSSSSAKSLVSAADASSAGPHVAHWRACCQAASRCAGG
jgi:hypothetical protein